MKKEGSGSFYTVDLVLHILYGIVFICCIISFVSYSDNISNFFPLIIFPIILLIIAFTRLSMGLIKANQIINMYEKRIKR